MVTIFVNGCSTGVDNNLRYTNHIRPTYPKIFHPQVGKILSSPLHPANVIAAPVQSILGVEENIYQNQHDTPKILSTRLHQATIIAAPRTADQYQKRTSPVIHTIRRRYYHRSGIRPRSSPWRPRPINIRRVEENICRNQRPTPHIPTAIEYNNGVSISREHHQPWLSSTKTISTQKSTSMPPLK